MTEPNKSKVMIAAGISQSNARSMASLAMKSMSRMKMRKHSFGFAGVAGIRTSERNASQSAIEYKRPPLLFLNTYQLEPHEKWNVAAVTAAADELLDELFTDHKYNAQDSPTLALRLAGELMRKVKAMNFNRYRVISVVTLMQKRSQSYNNVVSFIWDFERDNYVDLQRETTTAFVQVTVFGVYLD